jgi:hypothetical protein
MQVKKQTLQEWFRQFGDAVIERRPDYADKIDWNFSMIYYNSDYAPEDAAARYVSIPR